MPPISDDIELDKEEAVLESEIEIEPDAETGAAEGATEKKVEPDKKPDAKKPEKDDSEDDGDEESDDESDEEDDDSDDDEGAEDSEGKDAGKRTARQMYLARQRAREATRRAEEAERRAEEAERKAAEAETRATTGLETTVQATVEKLKSDETRLRADLKKAIEDGDTEKQLEIQDKWADLKIDLKAAERAARGIKTEREAAEAEAKRGGGEDGGRRQQQQQPQQPQLPEKFTKWFGRNQWLKNPVYAAEKSAASAIETELRGEGYDPTKAVFYTELDRRLRERLPRIAKLQAESSAYKGTSAVGAASAAAPSGLVKRQDGKVVYRLTADDHKAMREFDLDPNNKVHREEWAKSRAKSIQQEQAAKKRA